jgi:predicted amidohydrolase
MVLEKQLSERPQMPDNARIIRIALVQFPRERHNKDKNIETAEKMLSGIRDVDFVVFPEAWAGALVLSEEETGGVLDMFGRHAREGGYIALTGALFVKRGDRNFSVAHVIGPDGKLAGITEKIFPSFPVGERGFCTPGEALPVYEINGIRFGVLVCVDLFYPELARDLALRGARIIFNPSNIPQTRIPLWRTLVSARAAENTVYVASTVNTNTSYPDNRVVAGGCMLAAPWGDILFEADEPPAVHVVEADLSQPDTVRERWPYLADIESFNGIDNGRALRKPPAK